MQKGYLHRGYWDNDEPEKRKNIINFKNKCNSGYYDYIKKWDPTSMFNEMK